MTAVSTSPRPLPCGPLRQLRLWCDPLPRDGYHNMAADELLLGRPEAWLRFYGWSRPAVSFGYFDTQRMAARLFPGEGIEYIRRWTGGGIGDPRLGYTHTLTLPAPVSFTHLTPPTVFRARISVVARSSPDKTNTARCCTPQP